LADPVAEADAWLARLPQSQLAAAQAHTDLRLVAWIAGVGGLLALAVLLGRSGAIAQLRRGVEAGRPRPWLASAVCAGALALCLATLKALIDAVAGWQGDLVLAQGGGITSGLGFAGRLSQAASGIVPVTLCAVIFVPLLLWLMRRLPRTWPILATTAITLVVLLFGWAPYALAPSPTAPSLPTGATRDGLTQLIAETHLPATDIAYSFGPSSLTDVTGGFGHANVVVGIDLVGASPAEARAYVGHLIAHYVHNDVFVVCLIVGLTLGLGCFAAQRWGAALARRLGARDAAGPGEPDALPALAVIAILAFVLAALAGSAYLRWANVRADDYSLAHAREPDGLAEVLEHTWDHSSVDPSALERVIFYTHPPLKGRLLRAMQWKAAHGDTAAPASSP
jgi:STE24 endopeptidase